jgi:hypothetical protein
MSTDGYYPTDVSDAQWELLQRGVISSGTFLPVLVGASTPAKGRASVGCPAHSRSYQVSPRSWHTPGTLPANTGQFFTALGKIPGYRTSAPLLLLRIVKYCMVLALQYWR